MLSLLSKNFSIRSAYRKAFDIVEQFQIALTNLAFLIQTILDFENLERTD